MLATNNLEINRKLKEEDTVDVLLVSIGGFVHVLL